MRRVLLWGLRCIGVYSQLSVFGPPSLTVDVRMSAVTVPTPQPTDDVDIYFETPADDKEHSRFQRAKEQLEIRHRSRMERVRVCFDLPRL